jgi:ribosomal-protein-alanine acetyltransferase
MALAAQSANAAHWSREQYESLCSTGDSQLSERLILVVEDAIPQQDTPPATAHQIVAFLVAHRVVAEWELENIVVSQKLQRRGLGIRLLSKLIDHARAQHGSGIFLEVRDSNQSARALYRKFGFIETGMRKSYYSDTGEDAILYRLVLS